ncbi:MAG: hypothetical protein E7038_09580 [Lentisphaerae bacterium]|nr:hypothetical protein [Lentisphaerota bacterium]
MSDTIINPARPAEDAVERTVKMELAYDGTAYHGWQRQPNGITVQEVVEKRLCKLFGGREIRIQGSSRTDAGVHALGLVASCKLPDHPLIPTWKVHKALNRLLPPDIRIRSIEDMPEGFNARFSAPQNPMSMSSIPETSIHLPTATAGCWMI